MNSMEMLARLEQVNFTAEQARTITEIIEEHQKELATKEDVKMIVSSEVAKVSSEVAKVKSEVFKVKYDLIKWIVGGIVANGVIAALLKFLS